jgi:outer membrane lipoprotein-sorting protein
MAKIPGAVPLQTATKVGLLAKYNELAKSITSINAGVTMQWTSSSNNTGIIKQYPRVSGFILAQKPDLLRVIGQAPVIGTDIFNMVSDGKTFSIYIPSKNQFLTGPANLRHPSEQTVQNLRPQQLIQAIFWEPIPASDLVLLEQATDTDDGTSNYVLTVAAGGPAGTGAGTNWAITRKIWFERVGLTMARIQIYGTQGQVASDIHYSSWQPMDGVQYPAQITLIRPSEGYTLAITVTKLTANQEIAPARFVLKQPAGTQLVQVGEETGSGQN